MADIKFLDQEGLTTVLSKLANGDLKMTGALEWKNDGNGTVLGLDTYNHYIDVGQGYINFSSDRRLKENIQQVGNLLEKVLATNITHSILLLIQMKFVLVLSHKKLKKTLKILL